MINEKYSYKNLMNVDLSDVDASEFNNTEIYGSCFYQEDQDGNYIPEGNTININCSNRRIKVIENEDWICDSEGNPIRKVNE